MKSVGDFPVYQQRLKAAKQFKGQMFGCGFE